MQSPLTAQHSFLALPHPGCSGIAITHLSVNREYFQMSSSLQAGRSLLCSSQADSFFIIVVIFPLDEKFKSSCLLLGWGNDSQGAAPRRTQNCLRQGSQEEEPKLCVPKLLVQSTKQSLSCLSFPKLHKNKPRLPPSFLAASSTSCRATLCPETLPLGWERRGEAQPVPWLAPTEPYFTLPTSQQDTDVDRHLESPQEFHQCFVLFCTFHARGVIITLLWLCNSPTNGTGLL